MYGNDIKIFPIFEQTPQIWAQFAEIQFAAMSDYYYLSKETPGQIADEIGGYYGRSPENFAFGAYDGAKMVGFTFGKVNDGRGAHLAGRYLMRKYQKHGIGTRLMDAAERVSALYSDTIRLINIKDRPKFYGERGYEKDGVHMVKKLEPIDGSVPLFHSMHRIEQWVCDIRNSLEGKEIHFPSTPMGIAEKIATAINTERRPAYVAVFDKKVVGYLLGRNMRNVREVNNLYVHQEFRRRGHGRALMQNFMEFAKFGGASKLELHCYEDSAKVFYNKYCGLRATDRLDHDHMSKTL
ncbi:MAG: GNAT family N-acetyltransferase [Alphaproteobacteria bacterium]|nr:GNAT family N-acetyltransferase [Alphaproteobacteria bacterium]